MLDYFNENQGFFTVLSIIVAILIFAFSGNWVASSLILAVLLILIFLPYLYSKLRPRNLNFNDVRDQSKILFIDDKYCQIVVTLQRNGFDVRKIDDVSSVGDDDVQWANVIFVDYKGVGKKIAGKKEGLGLINELQRVYKNKKAYVIYSSEQDFDGLVGIPYIRKNASYDEFISLITSEISKL